MNHRAYLAIGGDDRIAFLQGLVTQDVTKLAAEKIQFAALLSPQGKILHDMFLLDADDHILIDTHAVLKDTLLKRLTLYRLRAKVTIAEISAPVQKRELLADPRHPLMPPYGAGNLIERIELGIPELTIDIAPDSMTAMDAGYDLLHGISFSKGCYVGQEVTARMHYKNIARKGFFTISAMAPLTTGSSIMLGDRAIGALGSVTGDKGLAFLKFEDALVGTATIDGQPVKIATPGWMQPKLALFETQANKQ